MKDFAEKLLGQLYADIEPVEDAYTNDSFAYAAIRTPRDMVLLQASLILNVGPRDFPPTFSTENIRVGHFPLSAIGLSRKTFLANVIEGVIPTPDGDLVFEKNAHGEYSGHYVPFHEFGEQTQSRLGLLSLFGTEAHRYLDQPRVDWELRGANTPYEGIVELYSEYQLGHPRQVAGIEIAALPVALIDVSSRITEETARVVVMAAPNIDTKKVAVGFRLFDQGKVVRRTRILGSELKWTRAVGRERGEVEFSVPRASVLHAFVSYNGQTQQHYWISDPDTFQNPRRAAYEASDPGMEILKDIIAKAEGKGPNADNFEAGVSWLFWMLGFSPALLSASSRRTDAPDFIVCTPAGHHAVVEVTTGLPKAERKMPNLDARAQAVRRMLDASSNAHLRVLPVLVTSKTRADIRSELTDTEKLGICVLAREDVDALLTRTLLPMNAEQLYEEAERAVRESRAKHSDLLPLDSI